MAVIKKGEMQDKNGDVFYPHTEANITFCADGVSVQEKLNATEEVLGDSTGKTGSLEVNDSQKLVTSDATHELANRTTFPDNKGFYPDCKDGKYGYNTDPNRGADTFHPFNDIETGVFYQQYRETQTITFEKQYDKAPYVFYSLYSDGDCNTVDSYGYFAKIQTVETTHATILLSSTSGTSGCYVKYAVIPRD